MRLTAAEKLFIERRRWGHTQTDHAKKLGLTTSQYVKMEKGEIPSLWKMLNPKLRDHERCVIMRRRASVTQREVARELGCSRYWVQLMETGEAKVNDLLWYWEQ